MAPKPNAAAEQGMELKELAPKPVPSQELGGWLREALLCSLDPGTDSQEEETPGATAPWHRHPREAIPHVFREVRQLCAVDEQYLEALRAGPLRPAPRWAGIAPAWASACGRLLLQPLGPREALLLQGLAEPYLHYLREHPASLLNRILGLYELLGPKLHAGVSHVAVVRSTLPPMGRLDYLYSLVGGEHFVPRTGMAGQLLGDGNFVEEQQVMLVPRATQLCLGAALQSDVGFLQGLGLVGYSLVLGIEKGLHEKPSDGHLGWRPNAEPVVYHLGIVDMLREFSLSYLLERLGTDGGCAGCAVLDERPSAYAARLQSFLEERLVPVDDEVSLPDSFAHGLHAKGTPALNTLSVLAAAEQDGMQDLARWRCLLDLAEAGPEAVHSWRRLRLVPEGTEAMLPSFCEDLAAKPLLPFVGEEHTCPKGVAHYRITKFFKTVDQARALRFVGGNTVSESSYHYSLALAVAVGVEAATLSSARVAEWSARLFCESPELVERPAAMAAQRTYLLPEAGSWLSAPHMLPGLQFVEHAPEVFKGIRASRGMGDAEYIHCVCQRDFSFIEFTSNSKSGEFFFFTHDARCMVKTISHGEAQSLMRLLRNGYLQHVTASEGSLLTRIFGLYQVRLPWFNDGRPRHLIVQENVLFDWGNQLLERFDLKGSTRGRTAKPREKVLKDNDWLAQDRRCGFSPQVRERLGKLHRRDCEFLASCGVLDYSLLVGFCSRPHPVGTQDLRAALQRSSAPHPAGTGRSAQEAAARSQRLSMVLPGRKPGEHWQRLRREFLASSPHGPHEPSSGSCVIFLGIIDFLVGWSCWKRVEYSFRVLQCQGRETSVNPPWEYARRQIEFVANVL